MTRGEADALLQDFLDERDERDHAQFRQEREAARMRTTELRKQILDAMTDQHTPMCEDLKRRSKRQEPCICS